MPHPHEGNWPFWWFQIFRFWGCYYILKSTSKISTDFTHCCTHPAIHSVFWVSAVLVLYCKKKGNPADSFVLRVQAHLPVQPKPPKLWSEPTTKHPAYSGASKRRYKNDGHMQLSFSQGQLALGSQGARIGVGSPCPLSHSPLPPLCLPQRSPRAAFSSSHSAAKFSSPICSAHWKILCGLLPSHLCFLSTRALPHCSLATGGAASCSPATTIWSWLPQPFPPPPLPPSSPSPHLLLNQMWRYRFPSMPTGLIFSIPSRDFIFKLYRHHCVLSVSEQSGYERCCYMKFHSGRF